MSFFFFTDPATTEIYTLSLHDALPISCSAFRKRPRRRFRRRSNQHGEARNLIHCERRIDRALGLRQDRKSTRLNSSHTVISYAVFCLKKKNRNVATPQR